MKFASPSYSSPTNPSHISTCRVSRILAITMGSVIEGGKDARGKRARVGEFEVHGALEIPDMVGYVYVKQFKLSRPGVSILEKGRTSKIGYRRIYR